MSRRFRICLFAWIAVIAASAITSQLHAQTTELTPVPELVTAPGASNDVFVPVPAQEWTISIVPAARTISSNQPLPQAAADYKRVFDSIPFSRVQYNANPNYRHDSTMEILTGNARHKTIVRHSTATPVPVRTVRPVVGVGNPYQYGYLRPALRLNYYKHFPSLNPYVNVWNYSGAY